MILTDKSKWGEFIDQTMLKYPDENVIRFVKKNFRNINSKDIHLIDYGCGAGRNAISLAREGFNIYAVDYNEHCIDLLEDASAKENLEIKAFVGSGTDLKGIEDGSMDGFISLGVFYYNTKSTIEKILKESHRVLKQRGLSFASFLTRDDGFYGLGKWIEEDTFLLDERCEKYRVNDLVAYFSGVDNLKTMYEELGFEVFNIERRDLYIENLTLRVSYWYIWARKK